MSGINPEQNPRDEVDVKLYLLYFHLKTKTSPQSWRTTMQHSIRVCEPVCELYVNEMQIIHEATFYLPCPQN